MDLVEASFELSEYCSNLNIVGTVILQFLLYALSVEGVVAGEDVELFVEDGLEAEVTHLARVDGNVLVLLLPLLFSKLLGIIRVVAKLLL